MKTGFPYYNMDTDRYQDRKIKKLRRDCGCDGIAVYDYILCEIYRVRGYFLEWDESTAFDVADYFGLNETKVEHIVDFCCAVGLFDKGVLTNEGILTSLSIQRRFIDMSKRAKRNMPEIPDKIRLIPEETPKLPEVLPKTPEKNDRVKKSKVEKSKEEESMCVNAQAREHPPTPSHGFLNFQEFILRHASRVSEMDEPFTEQQFKWLVKDFKEPFIRKILAEMHNFKDLYKNVNAYVTFKKFAAKARN